MAETVPRTWKQLKTWEELEHRSQRDGLIVILDTATTPHYHNPSCRHVARAHFEMKRSNNWRNGAYYWIPTPREAAGYAVACDSCKGQPDRAE